MKLSTVLQGFGVVLILALVVYLVVAVNAEESSGVLVVAVSASTLWTSLVLLALAKLLKQINE